METCKRLQRLRLYGIPLQLVSMRLLASGVSACRNMLHAVSLSDCGVTDAGFKVLVAALRDVPPLSSLRISGGRLTDASAKSLSDLIQTNSLRQTEWVWSSQLCAGRSADEYGSIGCLTILELPNNQLGDVAADALVTAPTALLTTSAGACFHCLTHYQCWCLPTPKYAHGFRIRSQCCCHHLFASTAVQLVACWVEQRARCEDCGWIPRWCG